MSNKCSCGQDYLNKISLEHKHGCVIKYTFFGAPEHFGLGEDGEIKFDGHTYFQYSKSIGTWFPYFEYDEHRYK